MTDTVNNNAATTTKATDPKIDLNEEDEDSSSMDSEEVNKILNKKYKRPGFACQYCMQKFSSRQTRDYHEAVARCFGKLYTCRRCLKPFAAPWRLERHQRQQVRCEEQDKVVVSRNGNQYVTEKYDEEGNEEIDEVEIDEE